MLIKKYKLDAFALSELNLELLNTYKAERIKPHSHICLYNGYTNREVIYMAKQGMKRIDRTHTKLKNEVAPVPEIQGKAKHTKAKANPIIAGTAAPDQKVYHSKPHSVEKPISRVYPVIDTDVARDNIENDLSAADLQDL